MSKKILLTQLRQLGDILLTTPAIRAVRQQFPDAQVDFLTHPMGKLILADNPYLDHVHYYDPQSLWAEAGLLRHIRGQHYDIVVDFMANPRSALYTLFSGAPQRLAFASRRSLAYTRLVPRAGGDDYIVRDKFRLIRELGVVSDDITLDIPWSEQHLEPFQAMVRELAEFRQAPLRVVLSPTHRREARQWPLASYAKLADRLVKEWKATVIWIWGPGEEPVIDAVMGMTKNPTIKAYKTSFRELAALIANCDLFVGNSNGPSHVAVAAGICSFQLHGPTSLRAWCPMNQRHQGIQSPTQVSSPSAAMADLNIESVWAGLQSLKGELQRQSRWRQDVQVVKNWREIRGLI